MINVAGAIIICNNQILLMQRKEDKAYGGRWEFPGGKQEPNESLEQCLKREIQEEIGKEINIIRQFDEYSWTDQRGSFCFRSFLCTAPNQEIPFLTDHQQYKWLEIDELGNYPVLPGDEPSIKKLQKIGADLLASLTKTA